MTKGWRCPRCNITIPPKSYNCPICNLHFDANYKSIERTWEEQEGNRMGVDDFEGRTE